MCLVVTGSISERGRMWPAIVFIFLWCTFVYNFTSYWVWSSNGWARGLGIIDHAGGIPIHITAGASSLAYSFVLGRRHTVGNNFGQKPHNINNIFVGTVLMWFGWFGFNGGSGLVISVRTVIICIVTNLSACAGGLTWCILDYFLSKPKHKFSLFGFCMGSIAGLVCVTPGSGYITIPFSIVFGVTGSTCVYFGRKIKNLFRIDDPFDIFAQHGIGGSVGSILTGIFAEKSIPAIDSLSICGGWLDGCWMQVIYQLIGVCKFHTFHNSSFSLMKCLVAGLIWSFSVTAIILLIMNRIPSLSLRTTIDGEMKGIDADQFGEYAYDYIEFQRSNATLQFNTLSAHELLIKTEVENVRSTKKQKIQPITKIEPLTVKSVA